MRSLAFCLISAVFISVFLPADVFAEPRTTIRFYKANKQLQMDRIMFIREKAKQEGCHNFIKDVRVYRLNFVGFRKCKIYSEKDCGEKSKITVMDEDNAKSTSMSPGISWYPAGIKERGKKVKSWHCTK